MDDPNGYETTAGDIRELDSRFAKLRESLDKMPASREISLAKTKAEEAEMWFAKAKIRDFR